MEVEFLGKTFEITREAITIGSFSIYWYGVFIAVGFLTALVYALRRAADFNIAVDPFIDCIIVGIISAVVGARLYYVIFQFDEYKDNLLSVFDLRSGGLAIYGAVIGALIGGGIMCKIRKVNILAAFDLTVIGFLFGQAIGRWGNFINQEAYGSKISVDSFLYKFGMRSENTISKVKYGYVHPCFFYESIWCLLGFVIIHTLSKKKKYNGQCLLFYMVWYGIGRFFIEGLRTDSLMWGDIRVSQILSLAAAAVGAVLLIYNAIKIKKSTPVAYEKVFGDIDNNIEYGDFELSSDDISDAFDGNNTVKTENKTIDTDKKTENENGENN